MSSSTNPRPLLWEEGMTHDEYKVRLYFYNGTAQPTHYDKLQESGFEGSAFAYPSTEDFLDVRASSFPPIINGLRLTMDDPCLRNRAECDEELRLYSLYGVSSIDIR